MADRIETDLIVEAISKGFTKLSRDLDKLDKSGRKAAKGMGELDKAGKKQQTTFDKLKNNWQQIAVGMAGVYAAIQTVKKVWDFSKEGAQIAKVVTTFDKLTASVGETSSAVLKDLRAATQGMVADTELMMASNRLMSMGLAETGAQAAELSKIAVTLGSAMGKEAGPAMEEFALLLANQSIPRLDTFGISAGKVKTRIRELRATNKNMTRETAFMTATMEEAAIAMDRLGGEIPVDKFTEFEVATKNLTDSFKMLAAEGLAPVAGQLSEQVSGWALTMQAIKDVRKEVDKGRISWWDYAVAVAGAGYAGYQDPELLNRLLEPMEAASKRAAAMNEHFGLLIPTMAGFRYEAGTVEEELAKMRSKAYGATEAWMHYGRTMAGNTAGMRETTEEIEEQTEALDKNHPALKRTRDELKRTEAAWNDFQEAMSAPAKRFDESLAAGLSLMNEELDDLGPRLVMVGGLTADQNDILDEATSNYNRTVDAMSDYASGLRGYGMEADKVAGNIEELAKEGEYWNGIIAKYSDVQGTATLTTKTATVNQEALNEALYESISATDLAIAGDENAIQTKTALGLALGILNEEQVEAIILQWEMTEGVEAIRLAMLAGVLSTNEAKNALLVLGSEGGAALQEIIDQAEAARRFLDNIPRNITVTTHYVGSYSGGVSEMQHGGPVTAHQPYIVGEVGPELFVPNQSGQIVPNNQIGSTGGVNLTLQFFGPVSEGAAGVIADETAGAVATVLGNRMRG